MDRMLAYLQAIPTEAMVFFVNTPNAISYRVNFQKMWDYSSAESALLTSCASLVKRGITHVVLYYPSHNRNLGVQNEAFD